MPLVMGRHLHATAVIHKMDKYAVQLHAVRAITPRPPVVASLLVTPVRQTAATAQASITAPVVNLDMPEVAVNVLK